MWNERIQNAITKYGPKHISRAIKQDVDLEKYLMDQTKQYQELTLAQRAYVVLFNQQPICELTQKTKLWKNFDHGWGFCGRASECECARRSVSDKVKQTKQSFTTEQTQNISTKRKQTNLERYGVENAAQTSQAIAAHKEFYSNNTLKDAAINKQQQTLYEKYGVTNAAHIQGVKDKKEQTNLSRYGVPNAMQNSFVKAKVQLTKKELYTNHTMAKSNYPKFVQMVRENFNLEPLISADEYIGVATRPAIQLKCISCGHCFTKRFDYASLPKCHVCFPSEINYKSGGELALLDYVRSVYGGKVISGDRQVINPYEIDIYLPEAQIGIEYCGLYWHSELSGKKSWNYHFRKFKAASQKNITLFTVWEDEWRDRPNVVKNLLQSKLGVLPYTVSARQCAVVEMGRSAAQRFYDEYHLIGSPYRLPLTFGLEYNDEVIAAMSFLKEGDSWLLTRFATHGRVPGAAGRLLQGFIKRMNPTTITSFSDNRYSDGGLYAKLGFTKTGTVPPMQQYVEGYMKRHDKRSMPKKHLLEIYPELDHTQTEWQLLQKLKYDRIWDCGKVKWTYVI
jgi:hypothetical protein